MTTKTIKTTFVMILTISLATSLSIGLGHADTEYVISDECKEKISVDLETKSKVFDIEKIRTNTAKTDAFNILTKDEIVKDVGVAFHGTVNPENCTGEITTISHQFLLDRDNQQKRIIVLVDPTSLSIEKVSEVTNRSVEASYQGSEQANWGGWTVREAGTEANSNIEETIGEWDIPTISDPTDPSSLDCGTGTTSACNFTVWTGLTDTTNGDSYLAQSGTNSHCAGTNCATAEEYDGWLQYWDNGSKEVDVNCDIDESDDFDKTDRAYSDVRYTASTDNFFIYLLNQDNFDYCFTNHVDVNHSPHYGQFNAERPIIGSSTNLGKVTDFYFEGYFYPDGVRKGLDDMDTSSYDWYKNTIGTFWTGDWVTPGTPTSNDEFLVNYIKSG